MSLKPILLALAISLSVLGAPEMTAAESQEPVSCLVTPDPYDCGVATNPASLTGSEEPPVAVQVVATSIALAAVAALAAKVGSA